MSDKIPAHKRPDACKHHWSELQNCLYGSMFQMGKCEHHLDAMIQCCRQWKEQAFSCEGFIYMYKDQFEDKLTSDSDGKT